MTHTKSSPVIATQYRDDWLSVIYDATGDYVKSKRAMELAEINGLFDPIDTAATPTIVQKCYDSQNGDYYVIDSAGNAYEPATPTGGDAVAATPLTREVVLDTILRSGGCGVGDTGPDGKWRPIACNDESLKGNLHCYFEKCECSKVADGIMTLIGGVAQRSGVREALELAEDVLSRAPFSTGIWPNGTHPNTGIKKIRDAISSLSSTDGDSAVTRPELEAGSVKLTSQQGKSP